MINPEQIPDEATESDYITQQDWHKPLRATPTATTNALPGLGYRYRDEQIARLAAEVEKMRADIAYADKHAAKVEGLLWGTAKENEKLRAALALYREAVRIDATMDGPKFIGSNASALKRAWDADRAALEEK
jgi:hypothetical protein